MREIKLYYWDDMPNFGDLLNIELCKTLFNILPIKEWPEKCQASFIGSTLDSFILRGPKFIYKRFRDYYNLGPVNIWGSGFIMDRDRLTCILPEFFFRRMSFFAVRGSYSLERIKQILHRNDLTPVLADPGLLASDLYVKKNIKYKIGIIPHHVENDMEIFQSIHREIDNSIIIDMRRDVIEVLNDISSCEFILSSALHGLIVADSFNIPNVQLCVSNRLKGGNFKFNDYYSAYGIHERWTISLSEIDGINWGNIENTIIDNYIVDHRIVEEKKRELYKSFPYK